MKRECRRRELDGVTSMMSVELVGGRVSEANSSGVFLYVAFILSPQALHEGEGECRRASEGYELCLES